MNRKGMRRCWLLCRARSLQCCVRRHLQSLLTKVHKKRMSVTSAVANPYTSSVLAQFAWESQRQCRGRRDFVEDPTFVLAAYRPFSRVNYE